MNGGQMKHIGDISTRCEPLDSPANRFFVSNVHGLRVDQGSQGDSQTRAIKAIRAPGKNPGEFEKDGVRHEDRLCHHAVGRRRLYGVIARQPSHKDVGVDGLHSPMRSSPDAMRRAATVISSTETGGPWC
ncbi:hypothetical protein SPHINGO8AM_40015 [Sphingomonas sp. 8AM]|nr:hypothetical protein SPHINGO8AM_40015 [Sphingomonas sp. 8AM]